MLSEGNAVLKDVLLEANEAVSKVVVNSGLKLSEEDAIEFLNDANLVMAYILADIKDFLITAQNISQRLNISKNEAERVLENLLERGLFKSTEEKDKYVNVPLYFDDSFVSSSDILSLFIKTSQASLLKIKSKDIFSYRYEAISKNIIKKYQVEVDALINKMVKDSIGDPDCEIYATAYSFVKVSRSGKDK